eukprot:5271257-Pyramimonas_sp.AAC.1
MEISEELLNMSAASLPGTCRRQAADSGHRSTVQEMTFWTRSLGEGVGARGAPIIGADLNDRLGHSSEDRCEGELTM